MRSATNKGWFGLLAVVVTACSPGESETLGRRGETGQSGTDGTGGHGCMVASETSLAFDEVTSLGTAAALRDAFVRVLAAQHAVPLRWTTRVGGTTTVEFRVSR
jgi:hypothetical protein